MPEVFVYLADASWSPRSKQSGKSRKYHLARKDDPARARCRRIMLVTENPVPASEVAGLQRCARCFG